MIVVLVGVSGAGKDTLIARLAAVMPLRRPISATTRAPRPGETHGVDYFFLDRRAFEAAIADNSMFEWAEFAGNLYGTPLSELRDGDGLCICIRENQGALVMREQLGAVLVGVLPPSQAEAERRLIGRGDSPADVSARAAADSGRASAILDLVDHTIVNDDLDVAAAELMCVVEFG